MKNATEVKTATQSNSLRFSVKRTTKDKKRLFVIDIRLDDECKNGHQDFSITGSIYPAGLPKTDRNCIMSGAIGDEIAEEFPEYAIFNRLHLCDFEGNPMYATANTFYRIQNSSEETVMGYARVTEDEYKTLSTCEDENHLAYMLTSMGIRARWKVEAIAATKILEDLTGTTFLNDSTCSQWHTTDKELKETEEKARAGYYAPAKVQAREE